MLLLARGRLRVAQRQPEEALADLLAAGDVAHAHRRRRRPPLLPWRSEAALAHLALGEPRGARGGWPREELALARAFGAPRALGRRAARRRRRRRRAEGEELLREAVATPRAAPARRSSAPARRSTSARCCAAPTAAPRRASSCARRSTPRTARARVRSPTSAEIELRATGAKPRRVALTGLEALTASERRVAELAAQGLTNREIAQALFVTARTVEGHLTHAFRKLDLARARTSRRRSTSDERTDPANHGWRSRARG